MQSSLRPWPRAPRGLTAMGTLGVLIAVVIAIVLTLRLAPHYLDYYTLRSVLEGLPPRDVRTMSRRSLDEMLTKRFKINNLRDLDIRDIIDLDRSRDGDGTVLKLHYERREHLFYNVDVVLTFESTYEY